MGSVSSVEPKVVYVDIGDKREKVTFSQHCGSRDIVELLAQVAGVPRTTQLVLKDNEGSLVTISPTMPANTADTPYKLTTHNAKRDTAGTEDVVNAMLIQVAEQFNTSMVKAFKLEEGQTNVLKRIQTLEKTMEIDSLKLNDIDRCRKDISDIKDTMFNTQKKITDYNHLAMLSDDHKISLKRDIPSYPKYTLSQETIDYLKQPTFDIWHWEPNEMLSLLEHMYHEMGLVAHFNINPITLKRWLLCVQENYRNNPFHNFRHCFCVSQMMYGMIHLCELWQYMDKEELGIMLTACVCHDLDHPGYNNTYQINARTELAVRYNDISPLENHHCAVAFQIFSNPDTNIFSNVDSATFKRIRQGMIMLILATDMARHSEILEAFRSKVDDFDFTTDDNINTLKMVLIKCCDISNEVRPFEVSEPWVDCLLEEYFNQSDREKSEGLPVAPFMDREKVTKPNCTDWFYQVRAHPHVRDSGQALSATGCSDGCTTEDRQRSL